MSPGRYPSLAATVHEWGADIAALGRCAYKVNKMFTKRSQPQPETKAAAAGGKMTATCPSPV